MARNYMQDITPPKPNAKPRARKRRSAPPPPPPPLPQEPEILDLGIDADADADVAVAADTEPEIVPERSIRAIRPSASRIRPMPRHEHRMENMPSQPRRRSRIGVWVAAAVALIALLIAGFLILFPSTSVTVIPHVQTITFDASSPFTAYAEESAAPGTIAYRVLSQSFEDSGTVQASGTEEANDPASGTVTIYNDYSEQPVELIKNTRFQTPEGLIFRIPATVKIPGKTAQGAGSMEVTVFADQAGPEYNVGPFDTLTVPGLKSSPEMFANVYARSTAVFSGGFSGVRPAVSEEVLEAARAQVRGRLQEKADQLALTAPEGTIAFLALVAVDFESLQPTEESGGTVRINERATVSIPIFPADRFAQSIGQSVSASAEGQSVSIRFGDNLVAAPVAPLASADLGVQPVTFTLGGRGQLVWDIDTNALAEALATREEAAFETVIQGFPAIEEARARMMPFWRSTFPEAEDITITIDPAPSF